MTRISPAMLNRTATINIPSEEIQGNGTAEITFTSYAGYRCAIQPRKSTESILRGLHEGEVEYVMYVAHDAITAQITHLATITCDTHTFRVDGPPRNTSEWDDFYTIDLRKDSNQ